ncbi:MAG: RBBP9/YdeN family alpha/beta hydrolase, partial [Candidatus Udaeobacter sp.]
GATGFAPIPLLRLRFRTIVVASSDDPYVTLSRARTFATAWGSDFVIIGEAGHINSDSGVDDWPEGLALLNTLRKIPNKVGRSKQLLSDRDSMKTGRFVARR